MLQLKIETAVILCRFKCGTYKFGGTDKQKTNFCLKEGTSTAPKSITKLSDLENYKVNNVVVQMGDDGTNDDVSLEVIYNVVVFRK